MKDAEVVQRAAMAWVRGAKRGVRRAARLRLAWGSLSSERSWSI